MKSKQSAKIDKDKTSEEELACSIQLRVYPTPSQMTVSGRWLHDKHRFRNQAVEFTQTRRRARGAWISQHPVLSKEWIPEEFDGNDAGACSEWLTQRLDQARCNVRTELGLKGSARQLVEIVTKAVKSLTRNEVDAIEDAWLLTVARTVLDQTLQDLDKTLKKAQKDRKANKGKKKPSREAGFPVFKKWSYPGSVRLQVVAKKNKEFFNHWKAGKLFVPGLGVLPFRDHGYVLPATPPKSITLARNAAGQWHVSFLCADGEGKAHNKQQTLSLAPLPLDEATGLPTCKGLDLGIKARATDSSGNKSAGHTRHLKRYQSRGKGLQRGLSRKSYGSNRWIKRKNTLGRATLKITHTRDAELRQLAKDSLNDVAILCLEDLFLNFMLQNRHLAANAHDAALGKLKVYLKREAVIQGKLLLECGRFDASTQTCSKCLVKNPALKNNLSCRFWTCPNCGSYHDRDENAAINIRVMSLAKSLATVSESDIGILQALGVKHKLHPDLEKFIVCGGLTALLEHYRLSESHLVATIKANVSTRPVKRAQCLNEPVRSERNGVGGFRC